MAFRTEVVLWKCGCSWIGICLVDKDKVQSGAVRVEHVRNASFVLFDIVFFMCSLLFRQQWVSRCCCQICAGFVTVPQPSKICDSPSICHVVAISWPWFGLSCSCGRTGQGGMERCGVMWCVVVVGGRRFDERTGVIARCRFADSGGGCSDEVETHVSNSVRVFQQIIKHRGYLFFVESLTIEIYFGIVWNFVMLSIRFTSLVAVRGPIV